MRLSRRLAGYLSMAASLIVLLAFLPTAALGSGGSSGGGTPGPCITINVPESTFTFNVGGDVTLKANVTNCSSDTAASQLIVTFQALSGGTYWCVYPESAGNPPNFSFSPGSTKSVSCTENAAINGSMAGFPADAQVFANCQSFSTQRGMVIVNLDGSRFLPPDQGFTNSTCALVATSNTYTVVSGINQNGTPRK